MKILVIDDERIAAKLLTIYLNRQFEVECEIACSCSDAITKFNEESYDFIILDLILPKGDSTICQSIILEGAYYTGLDLLVYFSQKNSNTHIVLCSTIPKYRIAVFIDKYCPSFACKLDQGYFDHIGEIIRNTAS